jgi:hypothetical protein
MNFLFWNTAQKDLSSEVAKLATERGTDFVILAEAMDQAASYLVSLNKRRQSRLFGLAPSFVADGNRLRVFSRLPAGEIVPAATDRTCSVYHVHPAGELPFTLACVHLPSALHMTPDDRSALAGETARLIAGVEDSAGHTRTVVIGDFNMNPFEPGMIGSEGFHAVLDRRIAATGQRKVQARSRPFFYNPMWRFMNDDRLPFCGSHYYRKSVPFCHFWNTFDQVLIRPELLPAFDDAGLSLVDSAGGKSLLDANCRPNKFLHSDHLPIHLNLNL